MFGGLTNKELEVVKPLLEKKSFAPKEKILIEGTPNNRVYFIVSGEVAILKHPMGKEELEYQIATLEEGDSFGEMELIDIQNCAATVECLSDVTTISLSNFHLYELSQIDLHLYTMLIMNLARDISRRLRSTNNLLAMVSK